MNVKINSRKGIEELLTYDFRIKEGWAKEKKSPFDSTSIISFYDPPDRRGIREDYKPVDFSGITDRLFQIPLHDIDIEILGEFGLTYASYLPQVNELAEFVYDAKNDGLDIICQCEYGQSRSAGCAAAICEHFYGDGIKIFADYRYYPNQLVYNKVFDALEGLKTSVASSTN